MWSLLGCQYALLYNLSSIHWFLGIDSYTVLLILTKFNGVSQTMWRTRIQDLKIPGREYAIVLGHLQLINLSLGFDVESALMSSSVKESFKRPPSNRMCVFLKCFLAPTCLLEFLVITENITIKLVFWVMKLLKDRFFSFHTSVLYLYHFYPCLLLLYLSTPFQIMTSSYFGYYLVIIVTHTETYMWICANTFIQMHFAESI